MTTETFNNVNFQILLKQHGGDQIRALAAWQKILKLGRFGDVPHTYAGGLDVGGLRTLADERSQKQYQAEVMSFYKGNAVPIQECGNDDLGDRIKQIEDIAAGDSPYK